LNFKVPIFLSINSNRNILSLWFRYKVYINSYIPVHTNVGFVQFVSGWQSGKSFPIKSSPLSHWYWTTYWPLISSTVYVPFWTAGGSTHAVILKKKHIITGFVTRLARRVSLVEQELLTLPEHLSSPQVFCGVRVNRFLALCVCFVDRCLSFCTFSFGHCAVCSLIYGFWLPLWYLQTLLLQFVCNNTIICFQLLVTTIMRVQAPLTIFLCILSDYTGILSDYKIYTNINIIYSYAIHVNVCMYACMLNLSYLIFLSLHNHDFS
jgi:hypothetical protein